MDRDKTWRRALDPQEWRVTRAGTPVTKEERQREFALACWVRESQPYDPKRVIAFYPDLSDPGFQHVLLGRARRQFDCGLDGISIDLLLRQAVLVFPLAGDATRKRTASSNTDTKTAASTDA